MAAVQYSWDISELKFCKVHVCVIDWDQTLSQYLRTELLALDHLTQRLATLISIALSLEENMQHYTPEA